MTIFDLIHSSETGNKIAGINAIVDEIRTDITEAEITRFANYLRIVIPAAPIQASKALGKLATTGANLTPDFVDFEVKRALEWLHADRVENRRFAAVLVLGELCKSAPSLLYAYTTQIIDTLWVALRDHKVFIRTSAAETLEACLTMAVYRGQRKIDVRLVDQIKKGMATGSSDNIHASLLAIGVILSFAPGQVYLSMKS